jgi:hypothetical protein
MNTVKVSFDLPGLQKKDVKIDVHNDVLAVSGETRSASERMKKDMRSATGDTASLGGRSRCPKQSRIRLCVFTSKAEPLISS